MDPNCLFCKIVAGQIPGDVVYQDDQAFAFRDIHPAAPVHVLVVPKKHLASLNELADGDQTLAGHLLEVARKVAEQEGIAQSGYRTIINTGANAGQEVFHLHVHVLGGHRMRHPMG